MSSSGYAHHRSERDPGLAGAAAVLLGILVAVLGSPCRPEAAESST